MPCNKMYNSSKSSAHLILISFTVYLFVNSPDALVGISGIVIPVMSYCCDCDVKPFE